MLVLKALLATLLLAPFVAAQEHVSFPTEDGGVIANQSYSSKATSLPILTPAPPRFCRATFLPVRKLSNLQMCVFASRRSFRDVQPANVL
jgi:hypothetical protein